jgi:hypothetical protein
MVLDLHGPRAVWVVHPGTLHHLAAVKRVVNQKITGVMHLGLRDARTLGRKVVGLQVV